MNHKHHLYFSSTTQSANQAGFALLITIIILSTVLAVGLSLLNISLRQINLTTTSRDSEIAFAAANAGQECARFSRSHKNNEPFITSLYDSTSAGSDDKFSFKCFGDTSPQWKSDTEASNNIYKFSTSYPFNPVDGSDACTAIDVWIINAAGSDDIAFTFEKYGGERFVCRAGSICTKIYSRGFNRLCEDVGDRRTVQRELSSEL